MRCHIAHQLHTIKGLTQKKKPRNALHSRALIAHVHLTRKVRQCIFFHPDYNRWLRIFTESARLCAHAPIGVAGLIALTASEEFHLALKIVCFCLPCYGTYSLPVFRAFDTTFQILPICFHICLNFIEQMCIFRLKEMLETALRLQKFRHRD